MTQVSRNPLPKSLEQQLHSILRQALADLHSETDISDFLDDLLTPTEKIMLGKRLAIAVLIEKDYDHRTISRILHVSVATVSTVHFWLNNQGKGYRKVIDKILKQEKWTKKIEKLDSFLEQVSSLSKSILPPIPKEIPTVDRI